MSPISRSSSHASIAASSVGLQRRGEHRADLLHRGTGQGAIVRLTSVPVEDVPGVALAHAAPFLRAEPVPEHARSDPVDERGEGDSAGRVEPARVGRIRQDGIVDRLGDDIRLRPRTLPPQAATQRAQQLHRQWLERRAIAVPHAGVQREEPYARFVERVGHRPPPSRHAPGPRLPFTGKNVGSSGSVQGLDAPWPGL